MYRQNASNSSFESNPYSAPRAPLYSSAPEPASGARKTILAGALSVLFLLGAGASSFGTYIYLKDDIQITSTVEKSEMELHYQDKIDRLRTEIERLNSMQIVDRESVELLVQEIVRRQESISKQHQVVSTLMDRAAQSGIKIASASAVPPLKPASPETATDESDIDNLMAIGGEPEPLTDPLKLLGLRGTESSAETVAPEVKKKSDSDKQAALNSVRKDLDGMQHEADTALNALAVAAESKVDRIVLATRRLGISMKPEGFPSGVGGPFIVASGASFEARVERAERALNALHSVKKEAAKLPVHRPVKKVRISSRFGPRLDPFLKKWALHSGIDFRAPYGSRIYAAGSGKVIHAGWKGGYGKVVILQHPNGLTTRYAHMSRIKVKKGASVSAGQVIGNIGSTGRSTGPHLHYEVRRGKKAIDPATFIATGDQLAKIGAM